jgi:hypothetical protein
VPQLCGFILGVSYGFRCATITLQYLFTQFTWQQPKVCSLFLGPRSRALLNKAGNPGNLVPDNCRGNGLGQIVLRGRPLILKSLDMLAER